MSTLTIVNKSCLEVANDYPENTFKCCVTSPPYKSKDGYSDQLMKDLAVALHKVLLPKGLAFINFGPLVESWGRSFDVYDFFIEAKFLPVTTIAWIKSMVVPGVSGKLGEDLDKACHELEKLKEDCLDYKVSKLTRIIKSLQTLKEPRQIGHYTPIEDPRRMNNLYEYIHIFSKEELPELDRWTSPLGVGYADLSNLTRGNRGKRGNTHCGGNVWFVPYETRTGAKSAHPHEFPGSLVRRCLTLAKAGPGDKVIEPFCGGATTLIVAKEMGIDAVGYEIDSETILAAQDRIKSAVSGWEVQSPTSVDAGQPDD